MKIAYLSVDDPNDFISWSGLKLNIYNTLKSLKHDVTVIGPLKDLYRLPFVIKREFYKSINKKYDSERNLILSKKYSKQISKMLSKKKFDLIFTSDTYLVSLLETKIPIVLWLDVTYKTYYDHYFKDKDIHKKSFKEANMLEKLALEKSNKVILTSNWSKKETIKNYKISSRKIHVIPFGANFTKNNNVKFKKKNMRDFCQLISVGVDWQRKGMHKSIGITKYLNKKGIKARLIIIGSKKKIKLPNYISQVGFLNKNVKKDYNKIKHYYLNSDFHILMTKKEACGVVFAEANSFGLFNITHKVGGVEGMIKNNVNGKMFNVSTNYKMIGNYIINIFNNKKKFNKLRKQSYIYYKKKLSWSSNSKKIQNIFKKIK